MNLHLLYVDCNGKNINFNISHSMCGGRGILPWVMTNVYQYVVEKYGESDKVFIKKYWDEADILFLLHFEGGYAVRQIEIHQDFVVCLSINKPIENEFFLYDQTLKELVIDD